MINLCKLSYICQFFLKSPSNHKCGMQFFPTQIVADPQSPKTINMYTCDFFSQVAIINMQ